jgi:hypothetical protein
MAPPAGAPGDGAKGLHTLANASVTTILPVIDLERARAFYERCLDLIPSGLRPGGKFIYQVGGSTLLSSLRMMFKTIPPSA